MKADINSWDDLSSYLVSFGLQQFIDALITTNGLLVYGEESIEVFRKNRKYELYFGSK